MEPRTQYHRYRKLHRRAFAFGIPGVILLMASAVLFMLAGLEDIGFFLPFVLLMLGILGCLIAGALFDYSKHEFTEMTGMTPDQFRRQLDRERRRQRRI